MARRRSRPRPSGGLESEILACLAAADAPMTAGEVNAELGGSLAYTTVMTTLSRLHAKQALTRTPRGRAYAHELVGGADGAQANVTAHRMQRLLAAGADRASVLSRFVDTLDPASEAILRDLLAGHADDPSTAPAPKRARRRSS